MKVSANMPVEFQLSQTGADGIGNDKAEKDPFVTSSIRPEERRICLESGEKAASSSLDCSESTDREDDVVEARNRLPLEVAATRL